MLAERRNRDRCPVCFGPTKEDESFPDGLKCRNSLCSHNHQHQACPRCGAEGAEARDFKEGLFLFSCAACQATWSAE